MASPPAKTLPSRSNSGSSSLSCCDAGLLYSAGSGGCGVEGIGVNPFGDARQLERWAPIQPLAADATRDPAEPPAGLWNTDRDTSVADALLRHILLFGGEGHGKSIRSFAQMAPRRRGDTLDYAAPSLAPLKLADGGGGGGGATARASGSSSMAAFRMSPQASVVAESSPGTPGHTARSKTLPHGLERKLLFGRTTRRTSAPGTASVPLRVSEHASRQV